MNIREFISSNSFDWDLLRPVESIVVGDDLAIMSHTAANLETPETKKIEHAVITICVSGCCHLKINLQEYEVEAPMLMTFMPGQIVEVTNVSTNYESFSLAVSKRFVDTINIPGWQQKYLMLYNNPTTHLDAEQLTALRIFFGILYRAAANTGNPFRLQVIENLIRVFYYGGISNCEPSTSNSTYKNKIVERFLDLVRENYRTERMIGFYADSICITPKYLSKVVKENTGRSAGEWIESHVILEARALLQSSDMTIQQIAAALNFPNQSFFGKYFKRATGMSPKQYRHAGGK